jgi:hypothetical protein
MEVTHLTKGKALTQRCGLCLAQVTAPRSLVNIYFPPFKLKVLLHCSSLLSMRICGCKASAPHHPMTQLQAPEEPNPTLMLFYALEVLWRQPFPGCEKCVMAACVKVPAHEITEVAHAESMPTSQMSRSEVGPLPSNAKSVDIRNGDKVTDCQDQSESEPQPNG